MFNCKNKKINVMVILIIILVVYLVSVYFTWRYIHIAYSKGGVWDNFDSTNYVDLFLTFCPFINTIVIIVSVFDPPKSRSKNRKSYNKFFKVKRNENL